MKSWVVQNSMVGEKHLKNNVPNQDCVKVKRNKCTKAYIIVACDGVSSCSKAKEASMLVCNNIIRMIDKKLDGMKDDSEVKKIVMDSAKATKDILAKEASKSNLSINDYGTTLELAILYKNKAYILHCGDGAIFFVIEEHSKERTLIRRTNNNLHCGISEGEVIPFSCEERWEYLEQENCIGVFLMTDGMANTVSPQILINYGYTYDPALLIPIIDKRCHKNKSSYKKYVNNYLARIADSEKCVSAIEQIYLLYDVESNKNIEVIRKYDLINSISNRATDDMSVIGVMKKAPTYKYLEIDEPDYKYIIEYQQMLSKEQSKEAYKFFK